MDRDVEAGNGRPLSTRPHTLPSASATPLGQGKSARRRGPVVVLLAPALGYLLLLFFIPLAILTAVSFMGFRSGLIVREFTLGHYAKFLTDPFYLKILLTTVRIAVSVGVLTVMIGYPVAYFLARTRSKWKGLLLALVLAPELSGVVLRTYGWLVILEDRGVVNTLLQSWGLIATPVKLVHNATGVTIGMTHVLVPFAILALMASIQGIDPTLELAAMNLGASRVRTFLRITLPLSMPGVLGAFFLTFSVSAGAYATPAILGGFFNDTATTEIYTQLLYILNWPFAAAMAVILMAVVLAAVILSARLAGRLTGAPQ
ncbi:MAG: ABC transporter permease [Armatimonadota bacterium]|nr:ABC transporter permease [Armatimonadota bacterium]